MKQRQQSALIHTSGHESLPPRPEKVRVERRYVIGGPGLTESHMQEDSRGPWAELEYSRVSVLQTCSGTFTSSCFRDPSEDPPPDLWTMSQHAVHTLSEQKTRLISCACN
ncbi:Hypothetical predicted protein [Xyrichtys novacula]|uniref:Uncharacterized protein n=1 Tax=Xyrichtys novacula TaxID=13765 RepID=A0AAV1F4B4_XYRNO|nr:Hypothetical predicted protein [Xyrichtys novacula]